MTASDSEVIAATSWLEALAIGMTIIRTVSAPRGAGN